ncbi:MAG: C4-type zinc ribbon domain-containing protein [Dictyoglomaceae bacterium]|nr:C4-type zinc ribbon domain-containing protein [Dictyoglomaceae bacterium]
MRKENIQKFINIQDLIIKLKEREKVFKNKAQEYEEFKNERLKLIILREEEIKTLERAIKNLKDEQKEKEDKVSILKEKYKEEEKKALIIKNPKEALHVEREMENLKTQIRKLEDEIIDIMLELEDKNNNFLQYKRELNKIKEEFASRDTEYQEEINKLKEEINVLSLEIEKNKEEISADDFLEFENLMKQKSDRAISRVINKEICEGCKLSLPKLILDKLRKKEELIRCPNCGRILWME